MPAVKMEKEFHPHCCEHLTEMVWCNGLPKGDTAAYICLKLGCYVRYNASRGYLIATEDWVGTTPSIRCPKDRSPMYLAEISPEHRSYRLWKCPPCDGSLANLDS